MGQGRSPWLHEAGLDKAKDWTLEEKTKRRKQDDGLRLGARKGAEISEGDGDGDGDYRQTQRKSKPGRNGLWSIDVVVVEGEGGRDDARLKGGGQECRR